MSEKNPYDISDVDMAKINETQRHDLKKIAEVKWLLELGLSVKRISESLFIPQGTVSQIRRGLTHREVESSFPVSLIEEDMIEIVQKRLDALQALAKLPKSLKKKPIMKRSKR